MLVLKWKASLAPHTNPKNKLQFYFYRTEFLLLFIGIVIIIIKIHFNKTLNTCRIIEFQIGNSNKSDSTKAATTTVKFIFKQKKSKNIFEFTVRHGTYNITVNSITCFFIIIKYNLSNECSLLLSYFLNANQ